MYTTHPALADPGGTFPPQVQGFAPGSDYFNPEQLAEEAQTLAEREKRITTAETAALCGFHISTIKRHVYRKTLTPISTAGNAHLFRQGDVLDFIEQNKRPGDGRLRYAGRGSIRGIKKGVSN